MGQETSPHFTAPELRVAYWIDGDKHRILK